MHAGGKCSELLINDRLGCLDQNLRLLSGLTLPLLKESMQALAASSFEQCSVPCGQASEMFDDFIFGGQPILADGPFNQRLQDLLCPPSAYSQDRLQGGAIDPGGRECLELLTGTFQATVP